MPLVKAFMDYTERSAVWKTDEVLAVCSGITRASGLEYILTRKCPLPFADTTKHPQVRLKQGEQTLRPILMHLAAGVFFLV